MSTLSINELPVEVVLPILDYDVLTAKDLANFSVTCKSFYEIAAPKLYRRFPLEIPFARKGIKQVQHVINTFMKQKEHIRELDIFIRPGESSLPFKRGRTRREVQTAVVVLSSPSATIDTPDWRNQLLDDLFAALSPITTLESFSIHDQIIGIDWEHLLQLVAWPLGSQPRLTKLRIRHKGNDRPPGRIDTERSRALMQNDAICKIKDLSITLFTRRYINRDRTFSVFRHLMQLFGNGASDYIEKLRIQACSTALSENDSWIKEAVNHPSEELSVTPWKLPRVKELGLLYYGFPIFPIMSIRPLPLETVTRLQILTDLGHNPERLVPTVSIFQNVKELVVWDDHDTVYYEIFDRVWVGQPKFQSHTRAWIHGAAVLAEAMPKLDRVEARSFQMKNEFIQWSVHRGIGGRVLRLDIDEEVKSVRERIRTSDFDMEADDLKED